MKKSLSKFAALAGICLACSVPVFAQGVTVIQGSGVASAINGYQFAGVGSIRIGEDLVSESSVVTLLSLVPGPGNSLVGQSSHEFNVGFKGTFTTLDDLRLVPVDAFGKYELQIRSQIVGGTGEFAGAGGQLSFNGFANLATGQVVWDVHGHKD
jgi:hypothetical protein